MMRKTTRNFIRLLVANAILLMVVIALWQFRLKHEGFEPVASGASASQSKDVTADQSPRPLPSASFLADLQGGGTPTDLADLKGQWTLLNIWASWCAPCIAEMPALEKLANDYKGRGLRVIAISVDDADNVQNMRAIVARLKFGATAMHWDNTGHLSVALRVQGVPMSYLVDPAGMIVATIPGERDWSSPQVRAQIEALAKL